MKNRKWLIAIVLVLLLFESKAQLPDYYFNIREVFPTSLNFSDDTHNDLRFRALKVKRGESESLVVELIDFSDESGERLLLKTIYVTYEVFDLSYYGQIQFREWLSPQKLELEIDGQCYVLVLDEYQVDKIVSKKCYNRDE